MEIVIIGSGHVATVLGRALHQNGHTVRQVWSRTQAHAIELAAELCAETVTDLSAIATDADLYILAVTDGALRSVAAQLSLGDRLVVHVAGAVSKEILQVTSVRFGVLWPMKMIRKTMSSLQPVTLFIDGNTETVTESIRQIALQLSPDVACAGDLTRQQLHVMASFISNFTNHLYQLAADFCAAENIDFSIFYPVITETAQRIRIDYPGHVQAGPAFRGDVATLEKHLQLLGKYPQLQKVYQAMTDSIRQTFGR